jgi:hypothetical protein
MLAIFSVIVGLAFAVLCVRKGFFPTWAIAFNVMIAVYVAVYVAVMLAPFWVRIVAGQGSSSNDRYHIVFAMFATAGIIFAVLQIIASTFITGKFAVTFPKLFNYLASVTLGFLTGKILASFLILMLCITPLPSKPFMEKYNLRSVETPKELTAVIKTCNFIASASLQVYTDKSEELIKELITPKY